MAQKNTTAKRVLTDNAQKIAEKQERYYGSLKNVLSAGIVAFDRLSAEQKQMAIAEANGVEGARLEFSKEPDTKKLWQEVAKIAKKAGVKIQIPKDL